MTTQDDLSVSAPTGAVLIAITEDVETTEEQGGIPTTVTTANIIGYKMAVPADNGSIYLFDIGENYTLENISGYNPNTSNPLKYMYSLQGIGKGIILTQSQLDAKYVNDTYGAIVEIPHDWYGSEFAIIDEAEALSPDWNLEDEINETIKSLTETNRYTELWKDERWRNILLGNYLKYKDPTLAKAASYQDPRISAILADKGMTLDEVQTIDSYSKDTLAYGRDLNSKIGYVNNLIDALPGSGNLDAKTIEWIANELVYGRWDEYYAKEQIRLAIDPQMEGSRDKEFQTIIAAGKVTQTQEGEQEIRDALNTWLPVEQHSSYLENIGKYASQYRNNPGYINEFIEELKDLKFTLYPMYDRESNWATISMGVKNLFTNVWGIDNIDPTGEYKHIYEQVLQNNDIVKSRSYLIQEGLNLNIPGVVDSFASDLISSFGGNIVPTQEYLEPTTGGNP